MVIINRNLTAINAVKIMRKFDCLDLVSWENLYKVKIIKHVLSDHDKLILVVTNSLSMVEIIDNILSVEGTIIQNIIHMRNNQEIESEIHNLEQKFLFETNRFKEATYLAGNKVEVNRKELALKIYELQKEHTDKPIPMICKRKYHSTTPYRKCKSR